MRDELIWADLAEPLNRPVLVAALAGWFDAAGAATRAVRHLGGDSGPLAASIDPDGFFNFTSRRPTVSLDANGDRVVAWPRNELRVSFLPASAHDLVLLAGEEPNIRWATFVGLLVEACQRLRCELVVTMGTVADAHPHTRRPLVVGSSTDQGLARRLGLDRPRYQGTTGVVGVLHTALQATGTPAISLRAPVPYYLASSPNPKATVALLADLERVLGVPSGHASLAEEVTSWERLHDEAVRADEDALRYVRHLEMAYDQQLSASILDGTDLAAELEAFLREEGRADGPD
jgi:hypothetical protein